MENNDKNRVPKLRYPGYTDFWVMKKLKDVANYRNGRAHERVEVKDGRYIIINSKFISTEGNIQRYTNEQIEPMCKGEIALVLSDLPKGKALAKAFLVKENEKYTLNQRIGGITPKSDISSEFLYYKINRNNYFLKFDSGVTQTNLSKAQVENFGSFYPNFKEQQAIGSLFKKLDDRIALQQRKIEHLRKRKAGLLQKMFPKDGADVPEVRFPEYTDAWVLRKLNDIGNTYNSLSGKSKEDFNHGDAHYVTYLNVFNNPVSSKNGIEKIEIDSKQQQVKYGDIFFTTSSETPEEVGMSSVWIYNIPNTYLNSFCFGYRLNVKYNLFFLSYVFRNIYFRKQIIKLAQGISRYNISKKKVLQLSISIPKLGEQEAIGSLFKKFDDLIALQQRKLEHLELQKRGLLQQMFV